jgi:putative oxidoreductase
VTTALDRRRDLAPLFIRAFAGTFLIFMSQDNVLSAARMEEFERFLATHGAPWPALAAPVSVYAQFLAGIAFLLGAATRPLAAIMVFNFVVALALVHARLPFRTWLEPCAMLASALFLLVNGAGALSVDRALARRRTAAVVGQDATA